MENINNTNKYNIDAITMLNGFSYLSYMYFQGEYPKDSHWPRATRIPRLPNLRPVCIFLILRGYTTLDKIQRECGASRESIKAELNALAKEGFIEKKGSVQDGSFLAEKKKCEEVLMPLYKRVSVLNKVYSSESISSDEIISGVKALSGKKSESVFLEQEEYKLGEALMHLYIFQKKLLARNRSFSELMILYYVSALRSANTFRALHRIMPHQSISNIRECCTRLTLEGCIKQEKQSSALWGEEGARVRKEKAISLTEEGLRVLEEEQRLLNEAMDNLSLNKSQEAGLRQVIKTALTLESRACIDPALPEKPDRRKKQSAIINN